MSELQDAEAVRDIRDILYPLTIGSYITQEAEMRVLARVRTALTAAYARGRAEALKEAAAVVSGLVKLFPQVDTEHICNEKRGLHGELREQCPVTWHHLIRPLREAKEWLAAASSGETGDSDGKAK